MAVSKSNCILQITISKAQLEQLDTIVETYNKEFKRQGSNQRCTRSIIMSTALNGYIRDMIRFNQYLNKEVELQKEKKDD